MTGKICEKHGVPEYCPDGVCRWCEPEPKQEMSPTEWLMNWKPLPPCVGAELSDEKISRYEEVAGKLPGKPIYGGGVQPFKYSGLPVKVDPTVNSGKVWFYFYKELLDRVAKILLKHQGIEMSEREKLDRLFLKLKIEGVEKKT